MTKLGQGSPRPARSGSVVRALGWSLTTDLASKLAVLVATFIAVRSLQPLAFGQFIALTATALLAATVWDIGVSYLVTREVGAARISVRQASAQAFALRLKFVAIWLTAFGVGVVVLQRGQRIPIVVLLGFAAGSVLYGIHGVFLAILKGRLRFRTAGIAMASGRWLTAGLSLLALPTIRFADPLRTLTFAFVLGEALTLVFSVAALQRSADLVAPASSGSDPVVTIRAAIPFAANAILAMAYNRFDVVILTALSSVQQLSLYAPASRIQDALYLLPSSLGTIALPIAAGLWQDSKDVQVVRRLLSQLVVVGLGFSVPTSIVISVFAPSLIAFVLGPEYSGAVLPTRILVWFLPLAVVQAPLLAGLAATGHTAQTTKAFLAAFIAALLFHLSLDWWWGATGAAVASLCRDPIALAATWLLATRAGIAQGLGRTLAGQPAAVKP